MLTLPVFFLSIYVFYRFGSFLSFVILDSIRCVWSAQILNGPKCNTTPRTLGGHAYINHSHLIDSPEFGTPVVLLSFCGILKEWLLLTTVLLFCWQVVHFSFLPLVVSIIATSQANTGNCKGNSSSHV